MFFFFSRESVQSFSDQTCATRSSEADAGHRCASSERTKGRRLGKLIWREVIGRTLRSAPCCDSGGLSEQRRCGRKPTSHRHFFLISLSFFLIFFFLNEFPPGGADPSSAELAGPGRAAVILQLSRFMTHGEGVRGEKKINVNTNQLLRKK